MKTGSARLCLFVFSCLATFCCFYEILVKKEEADLQRVAHSIVQACNYRHGNFLKQTDFFLCALIFFCVAFCVCEFLCVNVLPECPPVYCMHA